jgi:hypothetical protein
MTGIRIVAPPALEGTRHAFLLAEDRLGHYPEFRDFFCRMFELDRIGLAAPGYVTAPSGGVYALVFIGRSGERFPSGVEIYAVTEALEPLDDAVVDGDLWAFLRWMMDGVGGAWSAEVLDATGRLYKLMAAGG